MRIFSRVFLLILAALGLILAVVLYYIVNPKLPDYVAVQQVHYGDQWSAADRQTYYFTPQGTQVKGLHYDWFTALELPFSEQRFATPEYLARFGFLVDPKQVATAQNPGNLPVGFARHKNAGNTAEYLDITCAACHTGELHFKGQALRIDGGSAQHVLPSSGYHSSAWLLAMPMLTSPSMPSLSRSVRRVNRSVRREKPFFNSMPISRMCSGIMPPTKR